MVYNLWVYVYWFVYKTHFRHTVALAPENVVVRGLMTNSLTLIGSYDSIDSLQSWLQFIVEYI